MGRFKADGIRVRKLEWGEIEFTDTHAIKVLRFADSCQTTFWRWWAPRGSYGEWSKFRSALINRGELSYVKVFELAEIYEIPHSSRILNREEVEKWGKQ